MRMAESMNEILSISKRDRKHDKKEFRYLRIKKSQIAMSCLNNMNQYQIDVVNTYACNVAVDENEDHEPSIKKCTQCDKFSKRERNNRCIV